MRESNNPDGIFESAIIVVVPEHHVKHGKGDTVPAALQESLEASERRLQVVLDTVLDAIISIDQYGTIRAVNASACRLFGYGPEELIGQNVRLLMPPTIAEMHDGYLEDYSNTGRSRVIGVGRVIEAQKKDGTLFPAHLSVGENRADSEISYTGVIHDLSHRAAVQEKLDQATRFMKRAIDGTSDGIWDLNLDDPDDYYYSPRFQEMLGMHGRHQRLYDLLSQDHQIGMDHAVVAHLRSGSPFDYEFPLTVRGELRWFRARGKAERNAEGRAMRLAGTIADVTQRRREQEELKETQIRLVQAVNELERVRERLELAISGTFDGIWDWNLEDGTTYESPRMREMLQLDARPGLKLQTLMSNEALKAMADACQSHLRQAVPFDHEFQATLPSGEVRWFRMRGQAAFDKDLRPVRMAGSISDVTDRRQAMEALEEMAEHLSARVHERTAELRRANAELEKASRSKDAFLANMSHELRTPLNAVLGLTEALSEEIYGPISSEQRRVLNTIESSGKHLLALLSDVLDLARVHAGRLQLELDPTSVRDIIHASIANVRRIAEKTGVNLMVSEVDPDLTMMTDGRRIRQILINLLSNAVKFTPSGGRVMLEVRTDHEQGWIEFRVEDSGIGIAADRQEEIFQPFRQIDNKLSREYEGTGLGLALVSELVEAFGGSISLESELGLGSTFSVRIPWVSMTPSAEEATPSRRDLPERVLVVEDNPTDLERLGRLLQGLGVEYLALNNTAEVPEAVAKFRPDALLLDVILPAETGWEFMAGARELCTMLPTVVVSVLDDTAISLGGGAVAHVTKPFDRAILMGALRTAYHARQRISESRRGTLLGTKVLIAEDNPANLGAMCDYLRRSGCDIQVACNGFEAVQAAQDHPDVIIMDIQMPVLDGLDAIRQIRATKHGATIPIIAVTALAMRGDKDRCMEAGATYYLSKPVSLRELLRTIELEQARNAAK